MTDLPEQSWVEARLDARLQELNSRVLLHDGRFAAMGDRVNQADRRLDALSARVDSRLRAIDRRLDGIDARLDSMDGHLRAIWEQAAPRRPWRRTGRQGST